MSSLKVVEKTKESFRMVASSSVSVPEGHTEMVDHRDFKV